MIYPLFITMLLFIRHPWIWNLRRHESCGKMQISTVAPLRGGRYRLTWPGFCRRFWGRWKDQVLLFIFKWRGFNLKFFLIQSCHMVVTVIPLRFWKTRPDANCILHGILHGQRILMDAHDAHLAGRCSLSCRLEGVMFQGCFTSHWFTSRLWDRFAQLLTLAGAPCIWNIWKFAQEQFHQYHFFELTFFFIAVDDLKDGKLKIQALPSFRHSFIYYHQILPNQKAKKFPYWPTEKLHKLHRAASHLAKKPAEDHDHGQRDGTHLETYVSCGAFRSTRHLDGCFWLVKKYLPWK